MSLSSGGAHMDSVSRTGQEERYRFAVSYKFIHGWADSISNIPSGQIPSCRISSPLVLASNCFIPLLLMRNTFKIILLSLLSMKNP